jgi:hypothetical protein
VSAAALFPFFAGLKAEGWHQDIVCATKKIDRADSSRPLEFFSLGKIEKILFYLTKI